MSKTKEQVIEEYIPCTCGEIYTSRKMVAPDCPQHAFAIEEAMDEHAKNQAIDFAQWVDGKMYTCFLHTDEGVKHWHDMNEKGNLTTEQIYNLFLQSQS